MSIARATSIIEAIAGRALTNQEIIDLATDYCTARSDVTGLTNEELAILFITQVRADCKQRIKQGRLNLTINSNPQLNNPGSELDETPP